jgi:hypothetical protein
MKFAALAFVVASMAAPAAAQSGPAAPSVPQRGPAAVWNDQDYVNENPILSADLGYGDTGGFTAVWDRKANQLCYMITAPSVRDATGARIVSGGKAVVTLAAPSGGSSGACVPVTAAVAEAMVSKPGEYSVAVASAAYPEGAVAGVLHAWDGVDEVVATAGRG